MFNKKKQLANDLLVAQTKLQTIQEEKQFLEEKLEKANREVTRLTTEAGKHFEEMADLKQKLGQAHIDRTDLAQQLELAKKSQPKEYSDKDLSDINLKDLFNNSSDDKTDTPDDFNPSLN